MKKDTLVKVEIVRIPFTAAFGFYLFIKVIYFCDLNKTEYNLKNTNPTSKICIYLIGDFNLTSFN